MKYMLTVDETRSYLNYVTVETDIDENEFDKLLGDIEHEGLGEDTVAGFTKSLESNGIKVIEVKEDSEPYYYETEVSEFEEIEGWIWISRLKEKW